MSEISNINEAWNGHSGLEVETFIKSQLTSLLSSLSGKIGHVEMDGMTLKFYDEEGGTILASVSLGGDIYTISVQSDVPSVFYVLSDEVVKNMTITPSTTVSAFGSQESEPFPEPYNYIVAVNSGNGYVNRIQGDIGVGESATFDIKPYISTGDNYIRISITGITSGQTKTSVYTATLTNLTMSCGHAWQNIWGQGYAYTITGIRFSGSLEKTLHVAVDGVEQEPVTYSAGRNYTSSATTYTIPAAAFPASSGNGVHTVTLWMTAQGVSTKVFTFHILCVAFNDTTPLIAFNEVANPAVNYTSSTLLKYAVYNANNAAFNITAEIGGQTYHVASGIIVENREANTQYSFEYPLEIDTGVNEAPSGTLSVVAVPYNGAIAGERDMIQTTLDNSFSYIATPGALFYLNAATRDNGSSNYQKIVNEAGASQDGKFAAQYDAVWDGLSWNQDGWATDKNGYKALVIPAGASVTVTEFAPEGLLYSYPNGLTIEMMVQLGNPSNYDLPVFSMFGGSSGNCGIRIYPTKISVLGSSERSEVYQSVNLGETRMTHIAITFTKNYEGVSSRNIVSVYINGIANSSFSFDGASSFGNGPLTIGQTDTDAYLYKMRVYGTALSSQAVFNNFLNCVFEGVEFNRRATYDKNNILDGGVVGYQACKAAGYNTMVVIMDDDSHEIPSFDNQASYNGCSLRFEYADNAANNVTVQNVAIDGQGTTSKKYFRWNLRAKTNSNTVWTYGNGGTETGKSGYFAGADYARVDRITAKKNYASSMQGHKMGMTALYNDLFEQCGLTSGLPDANYRTAVYQFPFVGFRYYESNDSYEFIGLYTAGPDKGSKVTFGYDSSYGSLLSLEGPNHAPRGTRFLHPWVDVTYDYQEETLKFGGEEGWDCDYVGGGLSPDSASDAASILALYNREWKPAYELVFNCSPYIVSAAEMITALDDASITTIADLLLAVNVPTILAGTTNGISNQLLCFYDSSYELYFYRTSTEKFEKLADVDSSLEHNVVTYLYANNYLNTNTPTTAQIVTARASRFKAEAGSYWDVNQTLYHYAFCLLYGVTDNFAKNSYPFKFLPLSASGAGNRWGWREDDLDTVLATDNNGQNTKGYFVEHGDLNNGTEIYQGGTSALWVIIKDNYQTEVRQMMNTIANSAASIATRLGIPGDGLHNSMLNLVSYYCWEKSSKYFSATLYEGDRRWSYTEPWLLDASKLYNGVLPLTQALGDQYQAELNWMEKRIAYIFSKYRIGPFSGDTTGYGTIAFTLAEPFTFNIKPAIDLYPVISMGSTDFQAGRTMAGNTASIYVLNSGDTTNYIKGGDWLASLGDLSGMELTSRGGASDIPFSIGGARMKTLKIGDATLANVKFNATILQVSSPTLTELDARNTTTITNAVNLLNCPRLRKVLFAGSSATGLLLPVGAQLTEASFPEGAEEVFMHSLPYLSASGLVLPDLDGISKLYVNNCPAINPVALVKSILDTNDNNLDYATLIWRGTLTVTPQQFDALYDLANAGLLGYVDYQDGGLVLMPGNPKVEGTIDLTEHASANAYSVVNNTFPGIRFADLSKFFIQFADSNVETIALANWDYDGSGDVTIDEAKNVTTLVTLFKNNTTIQSFDELRYFTGLTSINTDAFLGTTSLQSIMLPNTVTAINANAFMNSGISSIELNEIITTINNYAFYGCASLGGNVNLPNLTTLGVAVFRNTKIKRVLSLGNITSIPTGLQTGGCFQDCTELESVVLPNTLTSIGNNTFTGCTSLTDINLPQTIETIGDYVFYNTKITADVNLPNLTTLGVAVFRNTKIKRVLSLGNITSIPTGLQTGGCFQDCTELESVVLPNTLTSIGNNTFTGCTSLAIINLPSSITTIGEYAFMDTKINNEINLPNLTTIANASFSGTKITKIIDLGNITTIPGSRWYGTFRNCTDLIEATIPDTVTNIGDYAFSGDTSLVKFICLATTPPTLSASAIPNNENLKIYVPNGSGDTYKGATNWSTYASKIYELDSNGNIPA